MDYGKGIRTVRLDYDEVMIIEESSSSEESEPKSTVLIPNNLGIAVDTTVGSGNTYKSILSNR